MFILPGGGVGGVGLVHKIAAVVVMVGWSCFVGIFYIIENFSHFIFKPKSSFMLLSAQIEAFVIVIEKDEAGKPAMQK